MTFSANRGDPPLLTTPPVDVGCPFLSMDVGCWGRVRERWAEVEVLSQSGKKALYSKAPPINHGLLDAPGKDLI